MPTQRSASRRGFLALAASAATAGCTGVLGESRPAVSVLAAGSLQATLRDLRDRTDVRVRGEAMGSAAAARLVASGRRDPDVLALADPALFEGVADWHARFATNALAVAHADTPDGRAVAAADRWFDPVLEGRATLGRTDPDLDPLGYRTLFAARLAAAHYDRPGLAGDLLATDQVYPETALLSQFETGGVDAAVVYRSMAVDRGYPTVDLPAAVDLSDPAFADRYADHTYELPDGTVVEGGVIEYGATILTDSDAARSVFDALTGADLLADHGFAVPEKYPVAVGPAPDALA